MTHYEVGKPFPGVNVMPGQDYTRSEITTGFFDILAYISDPTPDEIRAWRKGHLQYGLFEHSDIPFFIVDFPADSWNIDVNINVLKVKAQHQQEAWLNADGNIINLFLINTRTNILEGARMISIAIDIAEKIRDVLERQTIAYHSAEQVELEIANIQHTLTTAVMISRTKMKVL
ncbi:MAG TPA: hypothetical protein VGM31_14155 [Puia sp.]|jgi:hypothetical protein